MHIPNHYQIEEKKTIKNENDILNAKIIYTHTHIHINIVQCPPKKIHVCI